ncbi:hypothetical protein MHY20_00110 [Helcobacillus sp. ACRRO]|uniref:hypothetical protein n=1 Tax=Helcobacillus sp. ACRRO TaxID=2918202 RepID=UPI001EF6A79F|nr:hypothetical protein [Helcobacillus sp. ACRRO]MCG7426034.1 hypothetical protein [Helcobacillus sp. ACRRO]
MKTFIINHGIKQADYYGEVQAAKFLHHQSGFIYFNDEHGATKLALKADIVHTITVEE